MYEMYKHFFFKLYASNLIEGALSLLTFHRGLKYPYIFLYRKKCLKNAHKIYQKLFFQLYTLNYIGEVLSNKYQLFTLYRGVKLPLYPLISSRKGKKCIKNVKKS